MDLPYYYHVDKNRKTTVCLDNNNNNDNKKNQIQKYSYGILCISRDGYMVINKSPPYIKTILKRKNKNYHKQNYGYIFINNNEKYNILLNGFPNSSLEGEYTLPKGKIDDMDKRNSINTKVREFIEETKYTHRSFKYILNKHYNDPKFISFLNNEKYIIKESWLGLDNKIYNCEYSILLIDSMNELIPIGNNNNTVSFNYFTKNFKVYENCHKYYKRYRSSSNLDSQKETLFLPLSEAIELVNIHKINLFNNNDNDGYNNDSRIKLNDILKIITSL